MNDDDIIKEGWRRRPHHLDKDEIDNGTLEWMLKEAHKAQFFQDRKDYSEIIQKIFKKLDLIWLDAKAYLKNEDEYQALKKEYLE